MSEPQTAQPEKIFLADQFRAAGAKLTARPVSPDQSLKTEGIGPVVGSMLDKHNTVYFGEWHDDANDKFLADNPEIFQQAKARGGDKLFIESGSALAPAYKAYFEGKTSEQEFKKQLQGFNQGGGFSSGDSGESMTTQMLAVSKTAKENGVTVLPSDFRDLDPNAKSNLPVQYTSDVYGIPDIQGREDAVRHQTRLSLEEYKNMYGKKIGSDVPVTKSQQTDFKYLHAMRIDGLPDDEKAQFKKDLQVRADEFAADAPNQNLNYQNQLQFTYYTMKVEPGEKTLFLGGRNHISGENNTGAILEDNGYGTTGSVQLLANGGVLHDKAKELDGTAVPNAALPKPFDYTVLTQSGEILKGRDEKIEPAVAPVPAAVSAPAPEEPAPRTDKPVISKAAAPVM